MRALFLLVALAGGAPAGEGATPSGAEREALERRRSAIAEELLAVGAELRREVLRGDAAALLARVPEEGLRCGERVVPRSRVAHDLRSRTSWLHGVFFGGPGYAPPPGGAPSLAALLREGRDVAIVVSFRRDARAGAAGRPCLEFRAKDLRTPGAPLCFERRGGRWWLTDSLYPCW